MARHRAHSRSTRVRLGVVIAAILLGGGVGAVLSYDRLLPSPPPVPKPVAVSTPVPAPIASSPVAVWVDDGALDTAVRRALARIGPIQRVEGEEHSVQEGRRQVHWQLRTAEVRLHRNAEEAVALVRAEVEGAGGKVFSSTSSGMQVGLLWNGLPLVTHEVRFVTVQPNGRAVIIFDDAGGSLADLEPIIGLGRPVTVSVLPGLRYSREVAARAQAAGLQVFLHLPVEPEDPSRNLGPGGVTTAMSEEEIAATVRADLAWVPGAAGMNNHMGSRGTADERLMRAILEVAKERGLIFIDSMTSPRSVGVRVAAEMKIPTAARDIFLDNEDEAEAIRQQLRRLIALAKQRGTAVAIGHVQRMTAHVLQELLPEFDRQGIEIVPVSTVVH